MLRVIDEVENSAVGVFLNRIWVTRDDEANDLATVAFEMEFVAMILSKASVEFRMGVMQRNQSFGGATRGSCAFPRVMG